MNCIKDDLSIYDGAPLENLIIPNTAPIAGLVEKSTALNNPDDMYEIETDQDFSSVNFDNFDRSKHIEHKKTKFFCWQTDIEKVCKEGIVHNGPLTGKIKQFIEQCITQHTGSTSLVHLRSWWSILNHNLAVPKHDHRYQTKRKTISGVLWIQGDICPLFVQVPGEEVDQINNVPGRCVVFSSAMSHWTEPYPHKNLRVGISFDYLVKDQVTCDCENDKFCFRCVHLAKNWEKLGVNTIFAGGSRTETMKV